MTALLRGLRAVRRFRPDPIPEPALRDLLEVARWSGSAGNRQSWQVVVVRDRDRLRRLSEAEGYARHLAGAALGMVLVSAGQLPEQETFDEGRIAERIMLAALAHGIGSSIGWFRGAGMEQARRLLGVPDRSVVRTALSLGYPAEGAERGGRRRPLDDAIRFERF